jgi:HSP20 family protein
MTLVRFNPNRALDRMSRDFESMFESFFGSPQRMAYSGDFVPRIDVIEDKDKVTLQAELPGMKRDDIKVKFEDSVLTISGKSESRREDKDSRYVYSERRYGEFSRSFTLPDYVDPEHIKADYKDGVLLVEMQKKEQAKPREIEIKVS